MIQPGSMVRAGRILRQTNRVLIVLKRTIEKARGIEIVRIKREQRSSNDSAYSEVEPNTGG